MPLEAPFFPLSEPFEFFAGAHEELHFHLLELAHAEYELACHNLVSESLAYLSDAEGYAHAACFLHVEVVYEDSMSGFGAEVYVHGTVGGRAHFGFEHEVELAHFRPVLGSRYGANDFFIEDYLAKLVKVVVVHSQREAFVQGIAFGLVFEHASVCGAELGFVEGFAEAFCGFGYLFCDFIIDFCNLVFDEHVGAVALLAVAVVDEGVVEGVDVA